MASDFSLDLADDLIAGRPIKSPRYFQEPIVQRSSYDDLPVSDLPGFDPDFDYSSEIRVPSRREYYRKQADLMDVSDDNDYLTGVKQRARRYLVDPAITLAKGVIGVPEIGVGLADIVTGGGAGKVAEEAGYRPRETKRYLDTLLSPEQEEANKEVASKKGFFETAASMIKNPSTIAHAAIESVPAMLVGSVAGQGIIKFAPSMAEAAAAKLGLRSAGALAGAVVEGIVTAGQNVEQVRQGIKGGLLTPKQIAVVSASGLATGLLSILGGKVANKLGIDDIEEMLVNGVSKGETQTVKQILTKAAKSALAEGGLEEMPQSAQEQAAQNVAEGKPWHEGVAEAAAQGFLTGGLMGLIAGGSQGVSQKEQPEKSRRYLQLPDRQVAPPVDETNVPDEEIVQRSTLFGRGRGRGTAQVSSPENPIITPPPVAAQKAAVPKSVSLGTKILVGFGVDPDIAQSFAEHFASTTKALPENGEAFRTELLSAYDESGLKAPNEVALPKNSNEEQSRAAMEQEGWTPEQIEIGLNEARAVNEEALKKARANNEKIISGLGKQVPSTPAATQSQPVPKTEVMRRQWIDEQRKTNPKFAPDIDSWKELLPPQELAEVNELEDLQYKTVARQGRETGYKPYKLSAKQKARLNELNQKYIPRQQAEIGEGVQPSTPPVATSSTSGKSVSSKADSSATSAAPKVKYTFNGTHTVVWKSAKTGKNLTPRTRPAKITIEASSPEEASQMIREKIESGISKDQPRTVTIAGTMMAVDPKNGKVLGEKIPLAEPIETPEDLQAQLDEANGLTPEELAASQNPDVKKRGEGEETRESRTNQQGAMPVTDVQAHLESEHGAASDGMVNVVNEPDSPVDGRAVFDTETGKLLRIEVNAAKTPDTAAVDRVITHEVSHEVFRDKESGVRKVLDMLTDKEKQQIAADIERLGYGANVAGEETGARGIETLVNAWNKRTWFGKIVGKVLAWANSKGLNLTRRAAEAIAARAVTNTKAEIFKANQIEQLAKLPGAIRFDGGVLVPPGQRMAAFSITAHHGTPHEIKGQFSVDKIGTGEGAQVYGWGLYMAENPAVAKEYQKNLSRGWRINEQHIQGGTRGENLAYDLIATMGYDEALKRAESEVKASEIYGGSPHEIELRKQFAQESLDAIRALRGKNIRRDSGNIYTVSLDVEHEDLMDWDKPLSEQSPKIFDAVRTMYDVEHDPRVGWVIMTNGSMMMPSYRSQSEALAAIGKITGEEAYRHLTNKVSSNFYLNPKAASEHLNSLGIPGIRYLDQGSRGNTVWYARHPQGGLNWFSNEQQAREYVRRNPEYTLEPPEQTYNYVIFDDSKIKITHKNGQPVTLAEAQGKETVLESRVEEPEEPPYEAETRIFGDKAKVFGRSFGLNKEFRQEYIDFAKGVLDEAGTDAELSEQVDPEDGTLNRVWVLKQGDPNIEDKGRKLIQLVERELSTGNVATAHLVASIRDNYRDPKSGMAEMTEPTRNRLFQLTHSKASALGTELGAQGVFKRSQDEMDKFRNIDVYLTQLKHEAFGGPAIDGVLSKVVEKLKGKFTPEKIAEILNQNPTEAANLEKATGMNREDLIRLISQVFDLPFYKVSEVGERVSKGTKDPKKTQNDFDKIFGTNIKKETKDALNEVDKELEPDQKDILKSSPLWKKITEFVMSGGLDSTELLTKMAKEHGWFPPTKQQIDQMRKLVAQEVALHVLPINKLKDTMGDKVAMDRLRTSHEAAILDESIMLKRKAEAIWSQLAKPINFLNWGELYRKNNNAAIMEWIQANLLLKAGFATRQFSTILSQMPIYNLTRAFGNAYASKEGDFWGSLNTELKNIKFAYKGLRSSTTAARATLAGRGQRRDIERLMQGGMAIFERMQAKADAAEVKGDKSTAAMYRMLAFMNMGYRVAAASDAFQGNPAEYQEMASQVSQFGRKQGWSKAAIDLHLDNIIGGMSADIADAQAFVKSDYAERGVDLPDVQVREKAWNVAKARAYQKMRELDMPADAFIERNNELRNQIGWNLKSTGGFGGVVANSFNKARNILQEGGTVTAPLLPFTSFGNAIGTGINRLTHFTPFAFTTNLGVEGGGNDPWWATPQDRAQRKTEAIFGTVFGGLMVGLVLKGLLKVQIRPPQDKEERDLWESQGHKAGTVEMLHKDGSFTPFSLTTSPFAPLSPYLAASGAVVDVVEKHQRAQKKIDVAAEKAGVDPGKAPDISVADFLGVAASAATQMISGGRTASGFVNSMGDAGNINLTKVAASTTSAFVPLLPAAQEGTRLAGVNLDAKIASFTDFLLPLPTSAARRVNMLGEPVGTKNDVQRIFQILTGGTYPGIVKGDDAKTLPAYESVFASGFRPASFNPAQGYPMSDGTYRPLTEDEAIKYTVRVGELWKNRLIDMGRTDNPKEVRAAYSQAKAEALEEVGVQPKTSKSSSRSSPSAFSSRSIFSSRGGGSKTSSLFSSSLRGRSTTTSLRSSRSPSRFRKSSRLPKRTSLFRRGVRTWQTNRSGPRA